jgi:hypothetical protein
MIDTLMLVFPDAEHEIPLRVVAPALAVNERELSIAIGVSTLDYLSIVIFCHVTVEPANPNNEAAGSTVLR